VVRAYTLAREIFGMEAIWDRIDALDLVIPSDLQLDLLTRLISIAQRVSRWMLCLREKSSDLPTLIARYQPGARELQANLSAWLPDYSKEALQKATEAWVRLGVEADMAQSLTALEFVFPALDLVNLSMQAGVTLEQAARTYFEVEGRLDLSGWRAQINRLPTDTLWQTQARGSARDDVYALASQITQTVLSRYVNVQDWADQNAAQMTRLNRLLQNISTQSADLAPISVALRELRQMA
jgi:glutamate dehydrogenase